MRLKTLMAGPDGVFQPGSVIGVYPEEAGVLIAGGYAETVPRQPAPPEDEPSSVETAVVGPGDRAVNAAARARKTP